MNTSTISNETISTQGYNAEISIWLLGIAIVFFFLYRLHKMKKKNDENEKSRNNHEAERQIEKTPQQKKINTIAPSKKPWDNFDKSIPAKECFIENIDLFVPYLNGLQDGTMVVKDWTDAIISTNNYYLCDYWQKTNFRPSAWLTILQMWGITHDTCISFEGINAYKEMYMLETGEQLVCGVKYKVLKPCWILTMQSENGASKKKVLSKGIVEKDA